MGALTAPPLSPEARRVPGTYILVARLAEPRAIQVGRLGEFLFMPGYYLYVGSALGGLWGRLQRHFRAAKRLYWHIDYLLEHASLVEVWYILSPERVECAWASALSANKGVSPFPAPFGASDCRCDTHLFYMPEAPQLCEMAASLPYGEAVHVLKPDRLPLPRAETFG